MKTIAKCFICIFISMSCVMTLITMGLFKSSVAEIRAETRAELKAITASAEYKKAEKAHWERIARQEAIGQARLAAKEQ